MHHAQAEIEAFSRYITGHAAPSAVIKRYTAAIQAQKSVLAPRDQRLLRLALQWPILLSVIDAGLALVAPESELRRRLFLAFALLEATPERASLFLPRARSPLYAMYIVFVGVRAGLKGVIGVLLVKTLRYGRS